MCVMEYAGMYRGKQCVLGYMREMICDMCEVWVTYTQAQTLEQCATRAYDVRWVQCVKAWGRAYKQHEVHGPRRRFLLAVLVLPPWLLVSQSGADGGSMLGCMLVLLVPALVVWGTAFWEVMVTTRQGVLVAMWLGELGVIWQRVAGQDAITSEIWCPTVVACKALKFYVNLPGVY